MNKGGVMIFIKNTIQLCDTTKKKFASTS